MAAKEPLVLMHGVTMSGRVWDAVLPFLAEKHEVVAPTAPGHRGGPPVAQRPVRTADLVDAAERELDERGLGAPHIAGNSLGGWMAIELARRGRAATVCALSPAGFWTPGTAAQTAGRRKIRRAARAARASRPFVAVAMRSALVRRLAFRDAAVHGDRLTPEQAVESSRDVVGCEVMDDLLSTEDQVAPLDPLPCPITLAWGERDAILPPEVNGAVAQERLPGARYVVLPGVGHVPMIDDPELVAQTILETTGSDHSL